MARKTKKLPRKANKGKTDRPLYEGDIDPNTLVVFSETPNPHDG